MNCTLEEEVTQLEERALEFTMASRQCDTHELHEWQMRAEKLGNRVTPGSQLEQRLQAARVELFYAGNVGDVDDEAA